MSPKTRRLNERIYYPADWSSAKTAFRAANTVGVFADELTIFCRSFLIFLVMMLLGWAFSLSSSQCR